MMEVIAALEVVAPTGRFGPEERALSAAAVKATAASSSAFLGYAGSDDLSL
jgi:DNA-binding IclR family transcriptional regulator